MQKLLETWKNDWYIGTWSTKRYKIIVSIDSLDITESSSNKDLMLFAWYIKKDEFDYKDLDERHRNTI